MKETRMTDGQVLEQAMQILQTIRYERCGVLWSEHARVLLAEVERLVAENAALREQAAAIEKVLSDGEVTCVGAHFANAAEAVAETITELRRLERAVGKGAPETVDLLRVNAALREQLAAAEPDRALGALVRRLPEDVDLHHVLTMEGPKWFVWGHRGSWQYWGDTPDDALTAALEEGTPC
jgi:hypothetical protein